MSNRRKYLIGTLAVLLIVCVIELWRFGQAYGDLNSARHDLTSGADLMRDKGIDISAADIEQARSRFESAGKDLASARSVLDNDPILFAARQLPFFSSQINSALALAQIGDTSADVGLAATGVIGDYQQITRDSQQAPLGERASELLDVTADDMAEVKQGLASIDGERERITGGYLIGPLDRARRDLDNNIGFLRQQVELYDAASTLVPELLGLEGPRRYLLLSQDNTELFPTGGLISVFGVLEVADGKITASKFSNAEMLGSNTLLNGEYVEPPGPLKRYLVKDWSWNLDTSNWSPDFPTSAKQAMIFLEKAGEEPVDGVIGINFIVLEGLLEVLGPLDLPDYGVTVSSENATEVILEQSHNPRGRDEGKHTFPSKVADKVFNGVVNTPSERWSALLEKLNQLTRERQILLYFNDDSVEQAVLDRDWGGAMQTSAESDYLMLVDTSVLSTKLNLILEEQISISIQLGADGAATHRVDVSYHNPLPEWSVGKSDVLVGQMLGGFYGGYLRLYAPERAGVVELQQDGKTIALEDAGHELANEWYGSFFRLPSGESRTVTYIYVTPEAIIASGSLREYRLHIQKQSGTEQLPVDLTIELPAGSSLESVSLDGKEQADLSFSTRMTVDQELVVRYRVESDGS